ncbi:hypothetical protein J7E96_01065 [Streptomyces sp. ISL-96]|uniref:hypothetical protein n=1 Tax=Streptomyces sp. ISL-96 TaxID=2819191 RepID=UPI001BE67D9A|nr:hypothetical protein [Streptomyces sp. ISL-96]MBT2487150.1 hypothetical protein [Streptomyces sp. ISL-96]
MPEFPGWDQSSEFTEAYRRAVRTRSRLSKRGPKHPPIVLRTGPEEAQQALEALKLGLQRSSRARGTVPCTPYAHVDWRGGSRTELIAKIAEELKKNAPDEAGKLRLPTYDLLQCVAGNRVGTDARLADRVFARHRGRATAALPPRGEPGPAINAGLLTVPVRSIWSVAEWVYLRIWERRWEWRLARRRRFRLLWPENFRGKRTYAAALTEFNRMWEAAVGDGGGAHDVDRWDGLLIAALMTDLYAYARQGLLHPGRRRRRPRHALLLNGTRTGADGGDGGSTAVAGFIRLYGAQQRSSPNAATVVIAALPDTHDAAPGAGTLEEAARRLDPEKGAIPTPYEVRLPRPERGGGHGVTVSPVWTPRVRLRPGRELAFEAGALAVALWLTGQLSCIPYLDSPFTDTYTQCLTGSDHVQQAKAAGPALSAQYTDALNLIAEQNKIAETDGKPERTVTIAHVRASVAPNEAERQSGAAIPELRGLALAQQSLHRMAPANDNGVWVRIKTYDAGLQFKNARKVAAEIVREAKKDQHLIGVTGFTESRKETVAALRVLNSARIPIVSSTATAKAMEVGRYYHGAAPNNKREARVVSEFVKHANTVRTGENSCAPAESVAVVTDPTDVYSDELGKEFALAFPSAGSRIGYIPGGNSGVVVPNEPDLDMKFSMSEVAEAVCSKVAGKSRTLVYWTSRVREFDNFLETYQSRSPCANKDLTVMGGNELTNAALSGGFVGKSWLHLYHTAHMLPAGHPDRSATAKAFNDAYTEKFTKSDLWLNDGHAALAHDAVQVLAQATSQANAAGVELTRPNVQQIINSGSFDLEGASGRLLFAAGSLQRPLNKLLAVLHHGEKGSAPVLMCGDSGKNIDAGKEWQQGGTSYDCPEDE